MHERVRDAISAIPIYFKPETYLAGINVPDLHTLNGVLGAAIEDHTVKTLNDMRSIWDSEKSYVDCMFVRQPQTFPDVLLKRAPTGEILMGIELKGWYVLSGEAEPSFRFAVTPDACAVADLLVVVPWALSQVISGRPVMFQPYIEMAKYAAEYRNYWWEHLRKAKGNAGIVKPYGAKPYPAKVDHIEDKPNEDGGGNFGRFARTKLMDSYVAGLKELPLCGVTVERWLRFIKDVSAVAP